MAEAAAIEKVLGVLKVPDVASPGVGRSTSSLLSLEDSAAPQLNPSLCIPGLDEMGAMIEQFKKLHKLLEVFAEI